MHRGARVMTAGDGTLVLTVPAVAQTLKIGRNAAYELVASGRIRSFRLGRIIRVPRAEVEQRLHTECETLTGFPFELTALRLEGDQAILRIKRAGFVGTYTLRHVDGAWRFQPDREAMADYRLGLERLLRKRRAQESWRRPHVNPAR
jgi:excisionase family DNA binding protein